MVTIESRSICVKCSGVGKWPVDSQNECDRCLGTGMATGSTQKLDVGELYNDLALIKAKTDKMPGANVVYAYQVVEAMDVTEYNALSEAYKAAFAQLLSYGQVDLNEGAIGRASLWLWFGAESTTVASLLALIA